MTVVASSKVGKDSLNLIEFPIAFTGGRPETLRTLYGEDWVKCKTTKQMVHRSLLVTASDAWGLPGTFDEDVLIGLIEQSRRQDWFESRRVHFRLGDIAEILRITQGGNNLKAILASIKRWKATTLAYEGAWYDGGDTWVSLTLSLIDRVEVVRYRGRPGADSPRSSFDWGADFHASLSLGHLKDLDLNFYFGLSSGLTRRMYRYVRKHLYWKEWKRSISRPVVLLACDKMGLTRKADIGQLKRQLDRPLGELSKLGVIADWRYDKLEQGVWWVTIRRPEIIAIEQADAASSVQVTNATVAKLMGFGVAPKTAVDLFRECGEERCEHQMDWIVYRNDVKDKAAFLVKAIRENYSKPASPPPAPVRATPSPSPLNRATARSIAEDERLDAAWKALEPSERDRWMGMVVVPREAHIAGPMGDKTHRAAVLAEARRLFAETGLERGAGAP